MELHPWTARPAIRPDELARADLIALPVGTGARAALDGLLARVGAVGEPRWEVSAPGYVRMLAQRDLGVGVVSATTAGEWNDLAILPIADDLARSQLGVVWRSRANHPTQALLQRLRPDVIARGSGGT